MAASRDLRAAWAARPPLYSPRAWALLLALDRLPFPWGEEIMAWGFVARALVRITRLRQALTWASAQRRTRWGRWCLALSLSANLGRFVARSAFTGIRDLETLRRLVRLEGEKHLAAAGRGLILLGFHLGPTGPDLAFRIAGHRLTWIGTRRTWRGDPSTAAAGPPEIMRLYGNSAEPGSSQPRVSPGGSQARLRALYRARPILQRGENIFMTADGPGTLAFEVPLPGGPAYIRSGWMLLREITGASVLPVVSHMEGRTQVVTVYPALPPRGADPVRDLEVCRAALGRVLADYVQRFPGQCYLLAFPRSLSEARQVRA